MLVTTGSPCWRASFISGQVAVVQVAHGGHEGDAVLAAQVVAQFLDGMDDFQVDSPQGAVGAGARGFLVWTDGPQAATAAPV